MIIKLVFSRAFEASLAHRRPGKVIVLAPPHFRACVRCSTFRADCTTRRPGVMHNRQPRFNEGIAMWHLDGATLPLVHPLPGGA